MINGLQYLKKMYPHFDEKCFQPDGIDLRLGKVFQIDYRFGEIYGISEDGKYLPPHVELEPDVSKYGIGWELKPKTPYILQVDRPIHINQNSAQFYLPRSSLLRGGVNVVTALGDSDFNGILSFLCINETDSLFFLEKGVRFAQLIDFNVKGAGVYDGDYNISDSLIHLDSGSELDEKSEKELSDALDKMFEDSIDNRIQF